MSSLTSSKFRKISACLLLFCFDFFVFAYAKPDTGPKELVTCDGTEMALTCPVDHVIRIEQVLYGRKESRTCGEIGREERITNCSLDNALDIVSIRCAGKTECRLRVGQPLFQDPCSGTSKYLRVFWSCVPVASTCPGKVLSVSPFAAYVTELKENGGWYRDPFQHSNRIYYMGWFQYNTASFYEYNSPENLAASSPSNFARLQPRVDGTGFVVFDGNVYYNKESSRTVIKYDIAKLSTIMIDLPNANYHGTSPYAIELNTDIDLAVDENGLWAIYATEANLGNIVMSKLNKDTLAVIDTWSTSYEKWSALNAFIACGTLYVINYDTLAIDYMYNMTSGIESRVHIPIPNLNATTSSVKYNPRDQSLYVWDRGVASRYKITFQAVDSASHDSTSTPSNSHSFTSSTIIPTPTPTPASPNEYPNDHGSSSTTASSTPSVIHGSCPAREASGLNWPATPFSKTAVLSCPGDSDNYATWTCGGSPTRPEWNSHEPDLTGCVSPWIKDLEEEIRHGSFPVSYLSQELIQKLYSNKNTLTSWDIVTIIRLLRYLLEDATGTSSASPLADSTLKVSSELLQPALLPLWKNLERKIQTQAAVDLSKVLEDAAFFLSKDIIVNAIEDQNTVTWHQPYASLAIRIQPVLTKSEMKRVTFTSDDGDRVAVEDQALVKALEAQPGEKMVVVHLNMKNIAMSIVDQSGFGTLPYPANSQLVSVAARRMLETHSWAKTTGPLSLLYPVQLQLQHNDVSYSKHVCAYWNDNLNSEEDSYWWRSGCKRIEGNSSHSTCECNHLTNFVILSSNGDFPLLGANEKDITPEKTSSDLLIYVNVVRGAAAVSILMLVAVLLLLFCWSVSNDLVTIHKNLSLTVLLSQVVLVVGVTLTKLPELCAVVAGFLHFSVLSTFTWAAIETVHHLLTLHDMQEQKNRWKYYYIIGYVMPLLVVGISAAVDHTGYANQNACWLCTNGSFMWSIVVPCGVAICLAVACVARLLYKLNKRKTSTAARSVTTNLRSDAIKICVLMPLLCIMWSCAFVWLSGIPLMAWLFAASCVIYGAATLILRCFYHAEAETSWSCPKFSTKNAEDRFSHTGGASSARLVSTSSSYRPSLRGDGSAPTFDIQYAASRSGTATALLPASGGGKYPFASNGLGGGEEVALVAMQRPVPMVAQDHCTRIRDRESNLGNSFSSLDDGDCSHVDCRNPRAGSLHSRMERIESRSSCPNGSSRNLQMVGGCSSGSRLPHQYEKPASSERYCACTTSTSYSCCYDHLHEEHLQRGSSGPRSKRACSKCMMQQNQASYLQRACPSTHHYETLGPFLDEEGSLPPEGLPLCPHSYDEVDPDERCAQQIHDYHVTSHQHPRIFHQLLHPDIPESTGTPGSTWQNSSYGICHCPHVRGGKMSKSYHYHRNGRNSDPLSTDQGYDTDSQQPGGYRASRHSHSDGDDVRGTPGSTPGASSKMNSIIEGYPIEESSQLLLQRNDSLSGGSENDREVEFINSTSATTPNSPNLNCSGLKQTPGSTSELQLPRTHDAGSVIDTSLGGRNSATDTVHSWSALPGSNPRASFPEYGLSKTDRKATADPQVILAQAKQNCDAFPNGGLDASGTSTNAYTLPGTSETGTKARIDLRTGGISMITNL